MGGPFQPMDRSTIEQALPRFTSFKQLGQGAYGTVFEVLDLDMGLRVALKVTFYDPEGDDPAKVGARFCREFDLLSRARTCENVVTVYKRDAIVMNGGRNVLLWYTMERCQDSVHGRMTSLGLASRVSVASQLFQAVSYLSAQGVAHRDLKPANLFIVRAPPEGKTMVKLGDFGIARSTVAGDALASTLTATDRVPGTLLYMPPEAMNTAGRDVLKGDQYSAAIVAYEVLTQGHFPFGSNRDSAFTMMRAKADGTYKPLRLPDFPGDLEPLDRVLQRMLNPDPAKRFRHMSEAERSFSNALLTADLPRE